MKTIRELCASSFLKCVSLFYKEAPKTVKEPQTEEEGYEIIHDQSKNEHKGSVEEKQTEEKWVTDFEAWNKKEEVKKDAVTAPSVAADATNPVATIAANPPITTEKPEIKKKLVGVDEDAIIKEKVNSEYNVIEYD